MAKQPNWLLITAAGAAVYWLVNKQLTAASSTSTIPASDVVVPQDMISQLIPGQPLLRGSILQGLGRAQAAPPVFMDPAPPVNPRWSPDVKHDTRPFIRSQNDYWRGRPGRLLRR